MDNTAVTAIIAIIFVIILLIVVGIQESQEQDLKKSICNDVMAHSFTSTDSLRHYEKFGFCVYYRTK